MKRIIIAAFLCLSTLSFIAAQEVEQRRKPVVNAKGIPYLPEAGDFALGIDASPFLEYLGNFFNQAGTNHAPTFGTEFGVYGKYFLEDNQAVRAKLNLKFAKESYKQTVPNDYERLVNHTNVGATGIDTQNKFDNEVLLNIGYEFRRGKGRVQGFYGADLLLGYGSTKETYNYANPITSVNQAPSSYDFKSNSLDHLSKRTLENKNPYNFMIGAGAFVGVEYFITPSISMGGEVNFNFCYSISGQSEITSERFLGDGVQESKHRERDASDSAFKTGLFTEPAGSLFVMFHF
ncbi:MAG: hypothetical protein LBM08_12165 [Dysgonamonadaceae bacterium]|jgi:hypothetical protein|nr:hypothetical protein [Dysgonamonadaceae bacterium]